MSRVVLYTIPHRCPLCDEARKMLLLHDVAFEERDIHDDPDLLAKYRDEIPVVTVDGSKRWIGRIDPDELAEAGLGRA